MGDLRFSALERAGGRFKRFFAELSGVFLEREDVLMQSALALLAREHVLLTGPPGTAKSQLARAVLGRIVDANTGQPSLFARQFTENTVLTDLVGAIDFKTLMETGRSEHFTDEGIIGSAHAFLDEVFDGRDMLLRSTLNLLGEREFKQGVRTTHGKVECALMTSNRYLSEVLEDSRETLLAFVDRIAFVGFVPKGFSSPEPMCHVMRQGVVGAAPSLRAYLSIQDLDVLQLAAARVKFAAQGSDRLVAFLDAFEAEMQAAVRAMPDFTPSRYLSIRSRVRAGRVLKAIALYRKVVEDPSRPLEVVPSDFAFLRLVLLQAGPPKELLARFADEQDPRESRQLKIIQTERDVFERSLARFANQGWKRAESEEPPPRIDPETASVAELVSHLQQLDPQELSPAAHSTEEARQFVRQVVERALALDADISAQCLAIEQLTGAVTELCGARDPLTRWLHSRALSLLCADLEQKLFSLEILGHPARGVVETTALGTPLLASVRESVARAEELRALRPDLDQGRFDASIRTLAAVLTNRLREALHHDVKLALTRDDAEALGLLTPALGALEAFEAQAAEIHAGFAGLVKDAGTMLWPIVTRCLSPLARATGTEFIATFDRIWAPLVSAGIARHAPLTALLSTTLEQAAADDKARLAEVALPAAGAFDLRTYDMFRRSLPRVSLAYLAVQLCLRVDAASVIEFAKNPDLLVFAKRLAALPGALRTSLWQLDVQRTGLGVRFFECWLNQAQSPAASPEDAMRLITLLEQDQAIVRLRLESELCEAIFPEAATATKPQRAALEALLLALGGCGGRSAPS